MQPAHLAATDPHPPAPPPGRTAAQLGISLLELVICLGVLSVLLAAGGSVWFSGVHAAGELTSVQVMDDRLRRGMNRMIEELRFVDPDSTTVSTSGSTITIEYSPIVGWSGVAVEYDAERTLVFQGGAIEIDGRTIVAGLSAFTADYTSDVLTLTMTSTSDPAHGGGEELTRSLTVNMRL